MPFDPAWLSTSRVSANCRGKDTLAKVLHCWLTEHPTVASATSFYKSGVTSDWTSWPDEWRHDLAQEFAELVRWYGHGMPEPHPVSFKTPVPRDAPGDPAYDGGLVMSFARAKHIHFSHIANTLAIEMTGVVPWSIRHYSYEHLRQLLHWNEFLQHPTAPSTAYPGYYFMQQSSPATPAFVMRFFKDNDLVGTDAIDTVARLYQWCRTLMHYYVESPGTYPDPTFFWGPDAPPVPVSMVIYGTDYTGPSGPRFGHYTMGCTGTSQFFKSVLRVVNIPVEARYEPSGHAVPFFPTIDRALSHGDDPYDALGKVTPYPGYPAPDPAEYLITGTLWTQWFDASVDPVISNKYVGRRPAEIALKYLSDYILSAYCEDVASGASHQSGKVFEIMGNFYAYEDLEWLKFWDKLAAKAAATGFCS
jgi:hypothetical protein